MSGIKISKNAFLYFLNGNIYLYTDILYRYILLSLAAAFILQNVPPVSG